MTATARSKRTFTVGSVVLATLLGFASTSPVLDSIVYDAAPHTCAPHQCSHDATIIEAYNVGKMYEYDYLVDSNTEMRSASPSTQSNMNMVARVKVQVLTPCEFSVKVTNVVMNGKAGASSMNEDLSRYPSEFVLENSQVQRVCSHPQEPEWVTNIKKGVISSFQSTILPEGSSLGFNVTETDVVGICETMYMPTRKNGDFQTYQKIKHMETCRNNQELFQYALNLPDMNIQNLPLMRSEHSCQVTVFGDGRLESSDCTETHVFQPFSSASSGAIANVRRQVKLVGQPTPSATSQRLTETRASSLIFSHPDQKDQASNDQAKLVLALLNSFKAASETAKPEMFSQLVHSMRQLSHSQLLNIFYNGITDPELRILALDAIPLLKTDAGIALMKDIIETGELPSETLNMWYSTLPYYKNPTRAMLGVVSNFLRGEPINSALLGVSSLVSSYCSGHSDCQELPEIQAIITQYEQLLGSQCEAVDRAEEDKVILALKALRTIGHLRRGQAVVEKCYTDATNSMFIRLAAIDTIKQINCGQDEYDFKRQLFATFSDASADSELRIGAYLALMNCPSQSMVNLVKNVLVNEPVNQVGSFVWTHLTNLQESQSLSEHKQSLKTLVGRDFLQNKWRTDVRKFSRYFETSYYAKDLNVGATTDGQIIFSQDSYLPRSGMLNLTATVFGENLHLLEIGSRVEGFEAVFEDLFGPDGYFREDSLHKLLQSLRQKRDSNQDVSGTISDFQQKFNQELPDASPRGNMYMRMFGRDLHYASFEGLDNLLASVTPVSLFSSSSPNLDFSRSSIFLDGKIVVPTLAGFPLDLDVNGTSAVSLKSQNKFEMANLFKSGDANLEVKLYPTATLQISATMTIDAKHNQVGLKSLSKLHTSTYLDGEARMEGGKLMKARLNVPKKTVDVLDVSVDFFSMNDQGLYEPLTSENQAVAYAGCTPDSFNHVVGMKLCGSASYYNNPQDQLDLVFAGPLKMKIGLEKVDTFDKYTFEYQRVPASQGDAMTKMIAKWDTPGSSVNRLSKINLVLDESTLNFVKIDVEIPVRKIKINALYRMTDADKVIKASIAMENEVLLAIRQSIQSTEEGKYNVISRVSYKKIDLINLTGTFIATDKKMDVKTNLKSSYLEREIVADGSLVNTNGQWDIDGKIKSKWVNLDVKGLFIQTDTSFDFKSDLRYSGQGYNQAMKIQASYKLDGSGVMARHTSTLQFDPTNHPEWKTNLRWVLTNADSFLENDVKVKLGKHSYEVEQLFSSQATIDRQELIFALGFKAPERGIAHKIALEHRHETEMKVNRIELMLPGLIKFETHVIYNLVDNQSKRKLEAGLTYFENEIASTLEMVHRPDNSGIDGAAHLRWGQPNDPNTNIKADFKLDQRTPAAIDYALTANLVVPKSGPMKAVGDVKYVPGKSVVVLLKGKRGAAEFTTSIEVQKIAAGGKLVTILKTTQIDYSFNVMLRNDAIKSLHAVLNLDQKYELNAVAKRNFRDILFDLSYGAQPADRVVFNVKLAPTKVVAGLKMLGNEGKLKMERNGKIFLVEGTYNQDKMTMNGEIQNMPGDYFLKVDLTSTLKALKTVKLNLVHKIAQDQAKLAVNSQAQLVLNGKEHLIKFIGKKDTNILIELETKSAYALLDKIVLKFEQERVDKKTTNNVKIAYKADAFQLNTIYDNGKPKEGLIMVQTPWETYKTMKVGFLFNFGQQVELDTYCTWNEQSMATANVTGHLKASDIKLDFHMTQSKLGEAKAGVTYQKSSKSVAASTYLGYGENMIILDGVYQATPILANLKMDINTTPIKANGQLTIKSPTARALDVKSHLEFGNNHRAELTWASTFNSLVEHTVDAKIHVTGTPFYDVILKANNDKGVNALYQMTVMQGEKQLSEVKLDITNEMKTKHAKIVFGWNTIVTSVEVKHVVTGNTEYLSFVRIQSQEKVFLLKHNTKLTGDLKFYSNVELETPYVYMRKASTLVDIDIKPTELKAKATATFNDETLAIKTDGIIRLDNYQVKEVDVKADLNGFLGKMSGDAKFKKVAGQGASLIGNLNIANKPIKLTLSLKNIEGGAEFVAKVDAETPFSLEGSYSRNADLTHFKEMLALTYKTDLVFKCTSEIEIESWTDIKATGILDMPMIAEQPIDLSALLKLTSATLKAELTVKDVLTFTSQLNDKRADIKATLKYLDTYAVALRGEMSGGLKSVMATLTKNAKVWKAEAKVTTNGVEMGFEGIYKCPDYQQQIEAKLDLNAQGFSVIYQFLDQKAKLTGSFMCDSPRVCTMAVQMENEFYDALRNIKVEGKLDAADMTQATVNLIGHANDAEALKVTGTMKETSGDLTITMNLPIVKITDFSAKAVYEISEKEGHATLTVRDTKNVDFSWKVEENLVRVHLITPLTSIKEVSVLAKRVSTVAVKKINLELVVNSERIIALEGEMERPRAIALKLTTQFPALRTIEMAFNLNAFTDFHMAAAYNDIFEARLQGLLTHQAGKCAAKLRLPLHMGQAGYIASMEYDLTQHKEFKMILQSNQWKNSLIGYIKANNAKLTMELNNDEVFVSTLKYNLVQSLVGTADFTIKAPKFLKKPVTLVTKFDLAKEDKTVDVKFGCFTGQNFHADMKFKMTHDTFDGVMVLKSDVPTYEAATIKAKYNIATEPTAKLQIERNGKVNFVETKLKFDNIIPTVEITTSFPNFEKMIFKGNYNAMEKGHKQLDLALSRNDENIFVFALTSKPSANWQNADIVVTILTPITNWKTLNMELGWKSQRDPYALKIKLTRGTDEISFKGKVSINEGEFSLKLVTPFAGFESIGLSGKLGTTSLGKHMGITFDNNSVKRDVRFAYDIDEDNTAMVQIDTPLEHYKSIKIRSMMMADMGSQMDFSFETQGKEDFAIGLKYDFSRGLSSGDLLIKMINNGNNAIDLESKLEYNNVDFVLNNGFDGMYYLKWKNTQYAYAKVERKVEAGTGHTTLVVKTPIEGFENLKMELKSDYATKAFAAVELGKLGAYSADLKRTVTGPTGHTKLNIKTPHPGFELLKMEAKSDYATNAFAAVELGKLGKYSADIKRTVTGPTGHTKLNIITPHAGFESLKMEAKSDYATNAFAAVELGRLGKYSADIKRTVTGPTGHTILIITTPHAGYESLKMEAKSDYATNAFAAVELGKLGKYSADIKRTVTGPTGHTKLIITTPHAGYESLKMEAKSDYATNAFAAVELGKLGKYSADIKRTVTGPTGHTKLIITTPHAGYESLKMEAKSDYATNAFAAVELGKLGKYSADLKRTVTGTTGHTKLIIITPHAGYESLKMEAKSDYATIAFAAAELGKLGKYSADLKRTVTGTTGHTKLIIITPQWIWADYGGFDKIEMEATSDYATKLFASVKLGNTGEYSIKVNKVDTTYKVLATTPFRGYEKLMAEVDIKSEGKVVSVKLTHGDKWIGTFTTDVNFSMVSPKFVFKFEGPQDLSAEVKLQYNDGHAQIMWKVLKKSGDINIKYKHDGTTTSAELTAVVNGKHVKYYAERVWIVGKMTGESRFETNLQPYFKAKKTEFNYEIKYTKDYTGPWEIFYQRKSDGVESALVKLSLNVLGDKKFKFAGLVKAPELAQFASQLSPQYMPKKIYLEGDAEIEIKSDSVMMNFRYKTHTAKVEVKYSPAGASIFVTSNIPSFEKIQAQTKWTLTDKKFNGELQMKRNADVLLDTKLAVEFKPFTHFKFVVNIPTVGVQELEISYNNFANSEGIVTVEAKGIVVLKFTGKLAAGKALDLLELDVMGKTTYTGDFTFGIKLGLKHDQKNYGINAEFKTKTTVYKVAVEALDVDLIHYKGNLVLLWNLPGLPKISEFKAALNIDVPAMKLVADVDVDKVKIFNAIVNADVPAKKLTIDVNLKGVKIFELTSTADVAAKKFTIDVNVKGVKVLQLAGEVDWTPAAANIVLRGTLNNQKIELVAKRTGYEKINYSLNVFGKKITFVNANNIRSVNDFDVNAALDVFGHKITFVTANKIRSTLDFDVTGTLTISENISKMMNTGKAVQTIGLEVKSKFTGAELQINGKLSLNAKAINLDFKMKEPFEFKLVLQGIKNNLIMEYKNKADGKLFSLKINDKTIQIFENFSKMGGDYAAPIKFSMTENLQNTQLSLSLNIQDQSFKMKAGRGAKFIEINGKTKLTGTNKYYLRLQGATEAAPKLFDIKGSATYPLEWNLEVTFKEATKITFVAKAAQDLSECNVDFKIVRSAKEELTTTLKMVNRENEKSVNALFKFKTNTLKMDAKIVPGEIEIEFESTLPLLKKVEFEVEYKETALRVEFEYNELEFEVKFKHENDVWSFDAKHSKAEQLVNFVEAKFDKNAGTLKFKCKIVGKEMELDVLLTETSVKVEMTEPFTNAGKITLKGDLKQGPDGVSLNASGNVNGVDYVFAGYVGYAGELSITLNKGAEDIKIELNVANAAVGKSLTILVAGSQMQTYKVSVKYALANSVFTARVHAQVPPYSNNVDATFEIGYDYPKKMTLKTKFSHDGDVLVDIDAEFAMAQDFSDIRTTFKFASPPLGVPKMVGIKVVYRLVSATDFELTAEVLTPSDTYKAGAKFHLGDTKVDTQLRFGYGQKEYHMKLGMSLASTGTQIDMHQQTFKAYLNNFNLELIMDMPRFFQLYEDGKIGLKLKGESVNADGEQDAIYDLVFKRLINEYYGLPSIPSFNVEFVTELSPYLIPQSVTLDVQAKPDMHYRTFMQYDQQKMVAGYFIKSDHAQIHKSAEMIIQHGKEGVVEIIVGGLQKTKMTMQWPTPTNRVTRAIFDSPIYGNYEFLADLDQDINSAIVVLTTSHGIHKFAYQIHNEDKFELTTTVESPLISGGNPLTFHLLLDPVSKTYSSRIKLSEEYFVSVSLGLDIKDMQASFTIKLPPTFILPLDCEGQIHIKNLPKLVSCEMSFTHMGKKHILKVVFKKADLSLKVIARSPLLLGNEWSIKGNAVVAEGSHQISAVANIANEKIQLQGQIDHRSWMDFGGKIVYQGSSSILAKANVDFKFLLNLESESLIKFEVTSSHPALTQVKVMLNMKAAGNGYEGNFVAIFPKVDKIEASFKINTKNLRINGLNITASTLKHRVSADLTWDMNLGVIEGVILGPKASDKWVIKTKVTSEELVMVVETTRPGMEKIEMKVIWDPESTCEGGNGKLEMTFSGKKMEGELMYNMKPNAKYILASLNTPFENHNAYELQFGYEDSDNQKQAKAHLTTPKGQLGFLVDFYVNSLKDFLFLLEVDLPIPELKLTKIKLGHSIKEDLHSLDLGAEMTGFIINVDYRLKCDQLAGATILDVDARYNDISVVLKSYINLEDKKFDFVVKTSTPWGKLEIPLKFASTYDLKFNIIVNDVTRFVVTKSIATGTTSIEVKDIITPNAFKLGLIHDKAQGAASCSLELVWDTANAAETTEVVSVSWRNSEAAIEFGSQVTWRSRDTDAVTGKVARSHDQLQVTVSVLHNNRRDWGLDMSSQSTGQGQDLDHTKKVTVVVPSHAVEYNLHQRERSDVMHCDASLKWSQRDGPKHGLEYVYDVQKLKDDAYSHTLVVRQIGSQVQTFSTRYQTGRASQSVSVDINHSHDLTRRINLEASYDYTMINAQRTMVKAKSSYTFGSMPTQRNDVTLSLDEEKFVMEFADSSNIYTCEGKVTHQGIRQVTLAINGQAFSQLFVRMDKDKPLMKADLKFAEQSIRVSGGLKDSNIITFNVESQRDGEATVVELDTSLVLSSDGRVLKVEFDWRPEMLEESRQALAIVQDKVVARSQRALPHVLEHAALVEKIVRMTINETAEHIRQSLDIDVAQYFYVYETLVDNVKSLHINSLPVVKVVVTHATRMLTICVKEMTTLAQKTGVAARALVDIAQDVANDAVHFVFEHFKGTWEFAMQIKMAVIDEMAQLEISDFNVSDYVKVAVTVVRKALEKVTEVYKEWNEYLALLPTEVGGELEADIARILTNLSDFLKKFKTFNKVVALYWDYQSWFEEFHLSQHFEDVTSDLRSHFMDIGRELSQLKASLMEYWTKTAGKINGTINDYPLLAYSVSVGKKVVRVAHKMISQMSVEHNLKTWVRKIIGRADALASTLVRIIDVVYHEKDLIGYEFSHDLAAGNIVYKQVMPFQWHSFQDTPDIVKVAGLVGLNQPAHAGAVQSLDLKALQHDILEAIDVVSAAWHTKSVIPPFSATALVAGDSHIITFDQTYYNFAGAEGCSYLLTSDFSHGRFSAIANYDTDMRRTSIDVVTDGHTINIDTTPTVEGLIKVTMDKRNTQLPIQFDHTYAYREENTVVVENSEGLKISCNTVHNVCTVTISGWYFGKTGGLLGVYDNEPSNDWMTSEREIVQTLEEFVNSWSVTTDRQCPVKFFKNSAVAQPTLEEAQACESVFSSTEESSALMPCFSTIDPEPFKAMCLTDMQAMKNRADKQSGICSSAAAYIKQCKQAGVELWMPGHCVRCEINSQETMANGESTRIQGNAPQSADVVFVVQQSSCLNDLELHDLPLLVDRSLTSKGLTDNRYALVGFAGSEQLNRPHIFTSGSQIFNDVTRMKTSLDHLKTMQLDGSVGAGDIFEALQFSARLNLRAGVVKTFVLVRCDTSESMTSRAYGDSMTMLLEQGISMHVMMPLEMRLKGTTTKLTSKMFGFSKDSVITASALDKDLRRQLKDPKDQVSTLAQESGGAVFDLNRLKSRKRTLAKKASTMMGKALAELSKPLGCEVCDCLADADGKGRVMCHRCVLPSIDIVLQNLQDMLKQ